MASYPNLDIYLTTTYICVHSSTYKKHLYVEPTQQHGVREYKNNSYTVSGDQDTRILGTSFHYLLDMLHPPDQEAETPQPLVHPTF